MSVETRDFSDYQLGDDVYSLGGGVIPEIAAAANYELTSGQAAQDVLPGLIGAVGPDKELQKNIGRVKQFLGDDAVQTAADWVERSGVLKPVERSFVQPGQLPDEIDSLLINGGVARWMLRRAAIAEQYSPERIGRIILPLGIRQMGKVEHQLVTTLETKNGVKPTEQQFASEYLVGRLSLAGFKVELIPVESTDGDSILQELFTQYKSLTEGTMLVAGNAPSVIQSAGQVRLAARSAASSFDSNGDQLFMAGDTIQVARNGEKPATHQDPYTALGQIARNALFLSRQ